MEGQGLFGQGAGVVQAGAAVTTPGKSGKDTPKSLSACLWISPI